MNEFQILGIMYLVLAAIVAVWIANDFRIWRNLRKVRAEYLALIERVIALNREVPFE